MKAVYKKIKDRKDHPHIQRLKRNGLYNKFIKEVAKQKMLNELIRLLDGVYTYSAIIDRAMTWSNTSQGHHFWSNIDKADE